MVRSPSCRVLRLSFFPVNTSKASACRRLARRIPKSIRRWFYSRKLNETQNLNRVESYAEQLTDKKRQQWQPKSIVTRD